MAESAEATREAIRARARLWLRSERLMGLDSVPYSATWESAAASAPALSHEHEVVQQVGQVSTPRVGVAAGSFDAPRPAPAPRVAAPVAAAISAVPVSAAAPAAGVPGSPALFASPDETPIDLSPLPRERKQQLLTVLNETQVKGCTRCRLCETRTQTVFGEGELDAPIFFIGEGPGENEDQTGRPFVGRAGEKLNEMIAAMGLKREQVFIANVVKCRPPGNRAPAPDEVDACTPYLVRQIEAVRPKVIVTLGLPAAKFMLKTNLSMTRLRGSWQDWRGIRLMPTFHPAYVLRNYTVETRKAVWSDLQKVMQELGLKSGKDKSAS